LSNNPESFDFNSLVSSIQEVHNHLSEQAGKAVNISLTVRNWLIGCYIAEYELCGEDRAVYGEKLLPELAKRLTAAQISNCNRRQLYDYLRFYRVYPQIVWTVSAQLQTLIPEGVSREETKVPTVSAQSLVPAEKLLNNLSYSKLRMLVDLDDDLKRDFYAAECILGNWSVRELKRQIGSLYYERSGLSVDRGKLAALVQSGAEQAQPRLTIRDPYVFEFLGLKPAEVMSESHLEDQLTTKLQKFLLELGYGFCFEARQKRILIGGEHFFVDLVFYHRVLKCHVLVELKLEPFSQENVGQLNTYVSWYRENMMTEGDNLPVGILLCTDKNHALVRYALAGMDNNLFVSRYTLNLPEEETIRKFLEEKLEEFSDVYSD